MCPSSPSQPPDNLRNRNYESLVQDGIGAARAGNRALARRLLERAALMNGADSRIWLWLSSTTDDPAEQASYLERAVAADPSNAAARRGLVMLSEKLDKSRLMPEGTAYVPQGQTEIQEANGQAYQCPQCGGQLAYDIQRGNLTCKSCGYVREVEERLAADSRETTMDFVMPTTRAHRWAESQQQVACEQCGAITMLPAEQATDRCPYCGSNRFVKSPLQAELVDPQVIALMKISPHDADQSVKEWFGKGLLAPDDLKARAGGLQLRPAYYPFWTFDGTLEIPWACEVNEGTNHSPRWVPRSGAEYELFDDVLVAGLRAMPIEEVASIEPFNLKDLVEFAPEYLAGWISLTYDYPLADASLRAREIVVRKVSRFLSSNVEPTRQKRNFRTGAGKWSGLTFKHVLLPLYVGTYTYQGKPYRLLVNGQTGKVGGKKPRDRVKAVLLSLIAIISLVLVSAILFTLIQQ